MHAPKYLISLILAVFLFASQAKGAATRLHIILVIDAAAANVGRGALVNKKLMSEVINKSFKGHEERLASWTNIVASDSFDLTPDAVLKDIEALDVRSTDSIFFYYCGHGAWETERLPSGDEKGQFLAMSGGNLFRSDLRTALVKKHPYSIVMLTDCCSSLTTKNPPEVSKIDGEWETFHDLFFLQPGIFDITAAHRDQFGWANNDYGYYFTQVLSKWLCAKRSSIRSDGQDGFVSWREFYPKIREETVRKFKEEGSEEMHKYEPEEPQAFFVGTWPLYARYVRIQNPTRAFLVFYMDFYTSPDGVNWGWVRGNSWTIPPGFDGGLNASINGGPKAPVRASKVTVAGKWYSAQGKYFGKMPARNVTLTPPGGYCGSLYIERLGPVRGRTNRVNEERSIFGENRDGEMTIPLEAVP